MKENVWAECLVALYEQILYVFPLFVFYCVIENMQHVYCTWLNALFALVASGPPRPVYELTSPLATVIRTSYFPCVSCACDLSMWKTFAWYWKIPLTWSMENPTLQEVNQRVLYAFPAPHLFPVLHVARHIGSRAELFTVNNNVQNNAFVSAIPGL